LKKLISLILIIFIFLSACSPLGITGKPEPLLNNNDNEPTLNEIEVMGNIKEFSVTIKQFENKLKEQEYYNSLKETNTGYVSNNKLFNLSYKGNSVNTDEHLTNINILINESNSKFKNIEDEFESFFEAIFTSLEVSYDLEEITSKIIEKHTGEINNSEDIRVELTNNRENIQIIISSK